MQKRNCLILTLLSLCLLIFTGCGNQLSREAKEYKEQQKEIYESRATEYITNSLSEKYEGPVTILELELEEYEDYSYGFSADPYNTVATAQAIIGNDDESFDVYLRWNIDNNPNYFVCCDNREQDEIIADLDEYFMKIYGKEPYVKYYGVFPSLDYEIGKTDGMIQAKYSGNIEEYMTEFKGLINIALVYENLEDIRVSESLEGYEALLNAKNVYIISTNEQSITEDELYNIAIRHWIHDYKADITEYIRFKNGNMTYSGKNF